MAKTDKRIDIGSESRRVLLGSGAAVATARIFSLACTAVQLPILTKILAPSEYSVVALAIAVSTYFTLVTAEPVTLAFQRYPGDRTNRGTYRYALTRASAFLIIAGILLIITALVFGQWRAALAVIGWGIGLAVVRLVSTAWLMWADPWKYSANLMLSTGVRTLGLVGLVVIGVDPALSLAASGLASALATLAVSPRISRVTPIRKPPWSWKFGLHLASASLAVTILTSVGLLMLPLFVTKTAVGRFAATSQLATLTCGAVLGLISTVAYPALRRQWDTGHRRATTARLTWLSELCLAISLLSVAALTADHYWIPKVVVGDKFVAGNILPALVLSSALASMGQLSGWSHQFELNASRVSQRTWLSAIFGLITTAAGAAAFGIDGAAVGAMSGFLAYFLVLRWRTDLAPALGVATMTIAAGCGAVALLPASRFEIAVPVASALLGLAAAGHVIWRLREHQ